MESARHVRVTTEEETLEGVLVPSDDPEFYVLKLDSGYNIGIDKSRVSDVEDLGEVSMPERSGTDVEHDPELDDVTILHTGGTIASRVDYSTGAVVNKYSPEDILNLFPELHDIANIDAELVANVSSEMMRFDHYNAMARAVERQVEQGADGVIITHGTDTMHYSSAALAFALENVPIPVLFVGSQRSSDRPSTDAYRNLIAATTFIAESDWTGVGICMHASSNDDACHILPATKTRKMHSSRRDAFQPINAHPIATVADTVEFHQSYEKPDEDFRVSLFDTSLKIGMAKVHPHMHADALPFEEYDGLVLELYALGHAPMMVQDEYMDEHERIADRIGELCDAMPVVGASQCLHGRLDMDVYTPGRELQALGVLGNTLDMTPETAFVKLAWLLSNHPGDVEKLVSTDLRGELADDHDYDMFP